MKPSKLRSLASIAPLAGLVIAGCAGRNVHRELREDPKILQRGWTHPTRGEAVNPLLVGDHGFEYSTAAIYENTVIFGNQSIGLVSVYPSIQRERWRFTIRGGVLSPVLVEKKDVFFGAGDGFFYSISAETGKLNWKYELKTDVVSQPVVASGRVLVTTADDTVYALDAATGKWLWHYKRRTPQSATIRAVSTPLVDNGEVVVGMSDGYLVGLTLEEGNLKWEKKLHFGTKFMDVDASPVLAPDTKDVLYIPSYDGSLYALKRSTRDILWKVDSGGAEKVTLESQTLYFPSSDGTVYAVDRANGKTLWKFECDGGVPSEVALTDRYVIVASSHQYLYVLDKTTGKGLYRYNVGDSSGFSTRPVLDPAKKNFYLLSMGGNLYQFKVQ